MQQFDVCRRQAKSRDGFPYFVIVQSREFDRTGRRVVIPLTPELTRYPEIAPIFEVEGRQVVADALLIFSIPTEKLGKVMALLADQASAERLINAIDRLIGRS
jgi:hypothetical protein